MTEPNDSQDSSTSLSRDTETQDVSRRDWAKVLGALVGVGTVAACSQSAAGEGDSIGASVEAVTGGNVVVYTKVADLQAGPAGAGVQTAITLGYASEGDGGGGVWAWNPNDPSPQTNDPKFGLLVVPFSNPSTGRWKRIYSGPLNVKWFGAKGDGAAPDSSACQAAIAAASALPGGALTSGGCVFFPTGLYILSSPLNVSSATPLTLLGEGRMSRLRCISGTTGIQAAYATVANNNSLTISNLSLESDGNGVQNMVSISSTAAGGPGPGLSFELSDCFVSGATKDKLNPAAVYLENISNVSLLRNHLSGNGSVNGTPPPVDQNKGTGGDKGYEVYCASCYHVQISENVINCMNTSIGIGMFSSTYSTVTNNFISDTKSSNQTSGYGIVAYHNTNSPGAAPVSQLVISSNTIESTAGSGIYVAGAYGSSVEGWCTISGNTLFNTVKTQVGGTIPAGGICINGARGCVVSSNILRQTNNNGVRIAGSDMSVVTGNSIDLCGQGAGNNPGIFVTTSVGAVLSNNSIADVGVGIQIANDPINSIHIVGNSIYNVQAHGISLGTPGGVDAPAFCSISSNNIRFPGVNSGDGIQVYGTYHSIVGNVITSAKGAYFSIRDFGGHNIITGNSCWSSLAADISVASATSKVAWNIGNYTSQGVA